MKNQTATLTLGVLALLAVGSSTSGCGGSGATQTYIYFASDRDGDWDLYRMRMNGTDVEALAFANSARDEIRPMISPDGTKIVYASDKDGGASLDIYVANADGSGAPIKITDDSAPVDHPSWSPDSQQIVYARDNGSSWEIRQRDADGSGGAMLIFDDAGEDTEPCFTADGTEIVFRTDAGLGTGNLAKVTAGVENAAATILFADTDAASEPACSPDGDWIAFVRNVGVANEIHRIPTGGGAASLFAQDAGPVGAPAWTPDSKAILWVSAQTTNWEIWRKNLDGTDLVNVSNSPDDDGSPSAVAK